MLREFIHFCNGDCKFRKWVGNAKSGNFEYEIIIPKNKKAGIYIDSLSSHNEKEFLLNRNMWYEVVSFEEKDKFHKKIILKLLGNNKDD